MPGLTLGPQLIGLDRELVLRLRLRLLKTPTHLVELRLRDATIQVDALVR